MKYDNLLAFEKHLKNSAPHHFAPLYFIFGKDLFDCHEAAEILLNALIPASLDERPLHLKIFDGQNLDIQDALMELESISLLVKKRVVWIQHLDKLKKNQIDALEAYVERPHPASYLILTASTVLKNSLFYKKIEKEGVILEFSEAKPWEKEKKWVEWISRQAALACKAMPGSVALCLVKQIGYDPILLQQEWKKLLTYVGDKTEISLQDVSEICLTQNTETIWQLGEAIFRRDAAMALRIGRALLLDGHPLLSLLRQVRTQFQTEYQIATLLAQGAQGAAITKEFPYMKGQILERHMHSAREYGLAAFKNGLLTIDAVDLQAKNSHLDQTLLMEMLIIKLTHPMGIVKRILS